MKVTTDSCLFGSLSPTPSEGGGEMNVLDIGTGTGLLALMYAQKNSLALIDAIEIDKDAAEQAKENSEASPWNDRINIIHADARKFLFTKKYDLIISNPPFYEKELRSSDIQKNIAHHGEELSLQELLTIIKNNLKPGGEFFLLLSNKRSTEAEFLIKKNQLEITRQTLVRQSVSHGIFRVIIKGKHMNSESSNYEKDEISIWNEKQEYTPEFVLLLKDYYLGL
jgi:tRNA1Val (adenine37-N6)-methyltransferase